MLHQLIQRKHLPDPARDVAATTTAWPRRAQFESFLPVYTQSSLSTAHHFSSVQAAVSETLATIEMIRSRLSSFSGILLS